MIAAGSEDPLIYWRVSVLIAEALGLCWPGRCR